MRLLPFRRLRLIISTSGRGGGGGGGGGSGRRYFTSTTTKKNESGRPNISKVLIANRGEIACRIIRTCQRFDIPTVALYSVVDGTRALHVRMADEAYLIGNGPSPQESYLRQDEILQICREHDVHAIHPGYGFLSENDSFAQRVTDNGHVFIGPPASAMKAMGSKAKSKAIMEAAGVPTTPGYYDNDHDHSNTARQDPELLRHEANQIGYPILIKAVSGGGGKGMRLVFHDKDFVDMLQACQREATASFGDDRVLLEKYLIQPRHVEVQVIADQHGNVVSLHERDCSLQRRHQKIIEEAPASDLDPVLRQQLGEMGRKAAQAVGYENGTYKCHAQAHTHTHTHTHTHKDGSPYGLSSPYYFYLVCSHHFFPPAGTVEFLLDTQNPGKFYFCEMNTRLQVEHPITEEITGIDLVEWQLRVAAGEELPITDSRQIPCRGHAFEARIYAENPARGFLPATGKVWHHGPPAPLNTGLSKDQKIRVDTCIQSGLDVSVYYDPMISKLIVHGDNREQALQKLVSALKNYQIAGVPSNVDFLIKCAEHPVFGVAGAINTGFLDDYAEDVKMLECEKIPPPMAQAIGAFATMLHLENRRGHIYHDAKSPWSSHQGSWRMGGKAGRATRILRLVDCGAAFSDDHKIICTSNPDGSFDMKVDDNHYDDDEQTYRVSGIFGTDTSMEVIVNEAKRIRITTALKEDQDAIHICMWPKRLSEYMWEVKFRHPYAPSTVDAPVASVGEGSVKAPMPGKIIRMEKQVGEPVTEGDVVIVMEAMKMEHSIRAPTSGLVAEILVKVGDIVGDGAILLKVKSHDENENAA